MMCDAKEKHWDELFEKLVPRRGKCESVAGELIRAGTKIGHRYNNDGDYIGIGYGNETCNAAARYLLNRGSEAVRDAIRRLWGESYRYKENLDALYEAILDQIDHDEKLLTTPTDDMLDYDKDADYSYDEDDPYVSIDD